MKQSFMHSFKIALQYIYRPKEHRVTCVLVDSYRRRLILHVPANFLIQYPAKRVP